MLFMATLYFQLERSKTLKDGSHPIYLVLKLKEGGKEKRFRHYTGRSALQKHWIGKGETKKVSSKAPGAGVTNSRLDTLRLGADAILTNAKNIMADLTLEYFKERFNNEVIGKRKKEEDKPIKLSFFEHLDNFIKHKRSIFQPATIKTYLTLKKSLQEFEEASGYKVDFCSINSIFLTLYTKYLIEDTGVINNTLAKRIATLKAFLSEMKAQKINGFSDYKAFSASRNYDTTIMYLTEQELHQIQNLKLENTTAEQIRDVFCFACHTGLRYSDWGGLTPANIVTVSHDGKTVTALKFTMFKVHKEIIVPLNDYALSVLDKYKDWSMSTGRLFPVYTNQETNRTLKLLAKDAKINDLIVEIKKSGANRITYSNPKHEILTCHDARNTFATLYLEKGGRPEILKKLLGHSDIKQTMRYVKITEKAIIADHLKISNGEKAKVIELRQPA